MLPSIEKLLVLQDRDLSLKKAQEDIQRAPREEKRLNDQLTAALQHYEQSKLATSKIEAARKNLENKVKSLETQIAKFQTQQFETKKNEEFQALGHEIENAKSEIVKLEDQELELMEQYEAAKTDLAKEAAKADELKKHAAASIDTIKKRTASLEARTGEIQNEITELEKDIEPPLLSRYRRLLTSKGDLAIVPLQHGASCGGCHMQVTHQTAISTKASIEITTCEHCGRILYPEQG